MGKARRAPARMLEKEETTEVVLAKRGRDVVFVPDGAPMTPDMIPIITVKVIDVEAARQRTAQLLGRPSAISGQIC